MAQNPNKVVSNAANALENGISKTENSAESLVSKMEDLSDVADDFTAKSTTQAPANADMAKNFSRTADDIAEDIPDSSRLSSDSSFANCTSFADDGYSYNRYGSSLDDSLTSTYGHYDDPLTGSMDSSFGSLGDDMF